MHAVSSICDQHHSLDCVDISSFITAAHTMPSDDINPQAESGFAKGKAYDKHRATYAQDAIDILLEKVGVLDKTGAKVLDLAAGTGKSTEALAARDEQYEITAVEPLESMRRILADKKLPSVTVKDGTATSIPLEDASVEAVVCAQVGELLFIFNASFAIPVCALSSKDAS